MPSSWPNGCSRKPCSASATSSEPFSISGSNGRTRATRCRRCSIRCNSSWPSMQSRKPTSSPSPRSSAPRHPEPPKPRGRSGGVGVVKDGEGLAEKARGWEPSIPDAIVLDGSDRLSAFGQHVAVLLHRSASPPRRWSRASLPAVPAFSLQSFRPDLLVNLHSFGLHFVEVGAHGAGNLLEAGIGLQGLHPGMSGPRIPGVISQIQRPLHPEDRLVALTALGVTERL